MIALVVTVVILIILAVISMNAVFGEDGLIRQAEKASEFQANAEAKDSEALSEFEQYVVNAMAEVSSNGGNNGSGGSNGSEDGESGDIEENPNQPETPGGSDDSNSDEDSKTLVGYSYNGTVLPALPQYDEEAYPYVTVMDATESVGYYMLIVTNNAFSQTENNYYDIPINTVYDNYLLYEGEWISMKKGSTTEEQEMGFNITLGSVLLANYDILNIDGTTYIAASEPVPVYE